MKKNRQARWFSDHGKHLDRFGVVLGLSALSVTILALVDLDDPSAGLRSELGAIAVMAIVGLTLVFALRASGVAERPRRIASIAIGLVVLGVFVFTIVDAGFGAANDEALRVARPTILWTAIAAISPVVVLRRVMRHDRVTIDTLLGAISVYLLLALAFNYAFLGVDDVARGAPFFGNPESTTSFMYFSLVSITTVGYGDLTPVSDVGRFLAAAEAVLGQILLVTVVARLVSMYSVTQKEAATEQGDGTAVE